jgi:hypothetical protein
VNVPSTDNGLESKNGKIKDHHTLRSRMGVNEYLNNAKSMLRNWSLESVSDDKKFKDDTKVLGQTWETAHQILKDEPIIKRAGATEFYYMVKKKNSVNVRQFRSSYGQIRSSST